jgi:hypothetical protein
MHKCWMLPTLNGRDVYRDARGNGTLESISNPGYEFIEDSIVDLLPQERSPCRLLLTSNFDPFCHKLVFLLNHRIDPCAP